MSMIGKYLCHDLPPDGGYWSLSKFQEHITRHLYLVESLNPQTGEPNQCGFYLVDLRLLMLHPNEDHAAAKIFDDYVAVKAFIDWLDEPAGEKIIKLVRPT